MSGGNQDGYCTDCGEPVWWERDLGADGGSRLVTRSGLRWCQGKDESHPGMTHWHALPGMAQYVVRSPEGRVCHCLDRRGPHMHEIITDPPQRAHRLALAREAEGDDILAGLRAEDGHVLEYNLVEANRRLWELLEEDDRKKGQR